MSESESSEAPFEDGPRSAAIEQNARAWDALARRGAALAQPATENELRDPLAVVDDQGWLGPSIQGCRTLCLAAGGGRQSALYATAGAVVTVVDISREMLDLDRQIAEERGLPIRMVQTSMDDLSMLGPGEFDLVVQPVSSCYAPDVQKVYQEVARVIAPGGLYISQHKTPTSLQTEIHPDGSTGKGYRLIEPYYQQGPLSHTERGGRVREAGTLEFLHRWEELVGGLCRAGFVIEDLVEPVHAQADAAAGTHGDRSRYVAPYVRIKARRVAGGRDASQSGGIILS